MTNAEIFLKEFGLHEECYDFDAHVRGFETEMEAGLAGRKSSLRMLPSYLGVVPETPPEGEVIAIDAGGTNLRVALVRFTNGSAPCIKRLEKYRIPGSEGAVTKDEFFARIADHIGDRTEESGKLGFVFSFPCKIGADRDGQILLFDKEVRVLDSTGAYIGGALNAAFARMGKDPLEVTVLNDTAAALIGTALTHDVHDMGGYIGLIHGTGTNICYYDPEMKMLINTEAGGYSGFRQSVCDAEIDAESEDPGDQLFEKMVSGAYFSTVAYKTALLAAREGVLSPETGDALAAKGWLDAVTIDAFMRGDGNAETDIGSLCASEEDAAVLYGIFDGLYERSAKLVAIAITAVLDRSGATAERRGFIVAEGSSFSKGFRFQERFEHHIMARADGGKPYELVLADDHVVIGAAASVFL